MLTLLKYLRWLLRPRYSLSATAGRIAGNLAVRLEDTAHDSVVLEMLAVAAEHALTLQSAEGWPDFSQTIMSVLRLSQMFLSSINFRTAGSSAVAGLALAIGAVLGTSVVAMVQQGTHRHVEG